MPRRLERGGVGRDANGDGMMDTLVLDFLSAAQEASLLKQELAPLLADALNVPSERIFSVWMAREVEQSGRFAGSEWAYFFHGMECDLGNRQDGRFVQLEFGPGGRVDTFSGWGVMQFVMTSKAPWREFRNFRTHLAGKPPPYNALSGSYTKMTILEDELERQGYVKPADLQLSQYKQEITKTTEKGTLIDIPPDTPSQRWLDILVCDRWVLSDKALYLLAGNAPTLSDNHE